MHTSIELDIPSRAHVVTRKAHEVRFDSLKVGEWFFDQQGDLCQKIHELASGVYPRDGDHYHVLTPPVYFVQPTEVVKETIVRITAT